MSALIDILTGIGELIRSLFTAIASIGPLLSNAFQFLGQFFCVLPSVMIPGISGTLFIAIFYKIIGRDS